MAAWFQSVKKDAYLLRKEAIIMAIIIVSMYGIGRGLLQTISKDIWMTLQLFFTTGVLFVALSSFLVSAIQWEWKYDDVWLQQERSAFFLLSSKWMASFLIWLLLFVSTIFLFSPYLMTDFPLASFSVGTIFLSIVVSIVVLLCTLVYYYGKSRANVWVEVLTIFLFFGSLVLIAKLLTFPFFWKGVLQIPHGASFTVGPEDESFQLFLADISGGALLLIGLLVVLFVKIACFLLDKKIEVS